MQVNRASCRAAPQQGMITMRQRIAPADLTRTRDVKGSGILKSCRIQVHGARRSTIPQMCVISAMRKKSFTYLTRARNTICEGLAKPRWVQQPCGVGDRAGGVWHDKSEYPSRKRGEAKKVHQVFSTGSDADGQVKNYLESQEHST